MSPIRLLRAMALGACASAFAGAAAAQQASITGRVTDAESGRPVGAAQISVVGSNLGTQTNSDGVYSIRGVTAGTITVRVLSIGFADATQQATVTAGQGTTLNFVLRPTAIALSPVVVTATGEQRRVEVGNAIASVNATELTRTRAVTNVADLLTARAPGVMVIPGTQTGAGVRVRIRGTSSLSLTNNPIYIIDGIRVESSTGSSSVSVGGTTPSRVGDINPEEIESIEVVRGPSASTLYGTDAANGVIVITTKRGVAGRPQWTYWTEQTAVRDENDYPSAYTAWRTGPTAGTTTTAQNAISVQCFLTQRAAGVCAQDSVTSYNLHKDKQATPYGTGYRQQHGLQVRGGTDIVRYFLHGEWESEDGVTKVPEFEKRYLAERGLSLLPEQANPNHLSRVTARANLNIAVASNADVSVSAGYTTQDLRLPRSDDSGTPGIAANTYGGPGIRYNVNAAGDTLYGWREFTPRQVYQTVTRQAIERMIGSVATNWRPEEWLALRANVGLDYTHRVDDQLCRFSECTPVSQNNRGFKIDNRTNFFLYTLDAGATVTRQVSDGIESQTVAGVQYYRNLFNRNGSTGRELPPGAITVTAASIAEVSEATSESRTLGGFLEQRLALRDRLFVTGAIRSDRNSAFGADFQTVFYPKFSVSWVLSEEPFFPRVDAVNQLRLRSAYGASGVQPGTTDAVQYYSSTSVTGESGDLPGLVFSTLGNSRLKPERSTEIELGIDGSFFNNRISTELTYYNKSSRDALISRVLPPSIGTGATTRFENLGEVRNKGWEALLNAQLVQFRNFGWDVTFNGATNDNELVSLGGVPAITGTTMQQREGYPLNGWWSRRLISYEDKDNNSIITYNANPALSEIVVGDTAEFLGYSSPRREFAFTNGVDLLERRVRVIAMVDYKGGHLVYNNSERIRCASRNNCAGLLDINSSQFEQARTVMVREHPSRSVAGFFEEGDFIRFRELALTFAPDLEMTRRLLRGRSITASFAARNLGILWTKYTGVDPEAFGTTGDAPSSFQAFAPPTYYSFRLTLGF